MTQHLSDQQLIDLQSGLLDPEPAAGAKKHLKGCKACRHRAARLRARLGQLDALRGDVIATEDLIARTLRAAGRGAVPGAREDGRPAARAVEPATPREESRGEPDLFLRPRRNVLEMSRFFWLAAAAALALSAGVIYGPSLLKEHGDELLALVRSDEPAGRKPPAAMPASEKAAAPATPADAHTFEVASVAAFKDEDGLKKELRARAQSSATRDEAGPSDDAVMDKHARQIAAADAKPQPARAQEPQPAAATAMAMQDRPAEDAPTKMATDAAKPVQLAMAKSVPAPAVAAPVTRRTAEGVATSRLDAAPTAPAAAPAGLAAAAAPEPPRFEFTTQRVSFILPMTSGTWILQQNIRVRASVTDDAVKMDVSNHGALPVVFQLVPSRGTNVLLSIPLESGATTSLVQRARN